MSYDSSLLLKAIGKLWQIKFAIIATLALSGIMAHLLLRLNFHANPEISRLPLLTMVDGFMHISHRMRIIALQSAVGGMALSIIGMIFAATSHLDLESGAITQEIIDVLAGLNALRAAFPPKMISDL